MSLKGSYAPEKSADTMGTPNLNPEEFPEVEGVLNTSQGWRRGEKTGAVLFSPLPEKKSDRGLGVNGFKTETKGKRIIAVYNKTPWSAFRNNRPTRFVIRKAGTFCFSKML